MTAKRALLGACMGALVVACHWVLPIHEESAGPNGNTDGGGGTSSPADAAVDGAVVPPNDGAAEAAPAATCEGTFSEDPDCNHCLVTKCCGALDRCLVVNTECNALGQCAADCFTETCISACASKHPSGVSDFEAADQCTRIACASECDETPAPTTQVKPGQPCDEASKTSCNDAQFVCPPAANPFHGSCRQLCSTWADCPAFHSCCFAADLGTDVCIPTTQVPDGWTCQ